MQHSARKSLAALALAWAGTAAAQPAATELGTQPGADQFPQVEFVFEERVTLAPAPYWVKRRSVTASTFPSPVAPSPGRSCRGG